MIKKASKVLFTFVQNKQFRHLISVSPHSLTMLNTTNTECSFIEIWLTDQNSKQLELKENVNMTLLIGQILQIRYSAEPKYRKFVEACGFSSFARKCSDKYSKKLIDTATKTGIDAGKTASKRVVQKTAEAK